MRRTGTVVPLSTVLGRLAPVMLALAGEVAAEAVYWTQPNQFPHPGVRRDHASAYDPVRNRTVIFGGRRGATDLGDTWEWDGSTWTEVATQDAMRPSPRHGAAMAYDAKNRVIVLFGGRTGQGATGTVYNQTWVWDGTDWQGKSPTGPPERYGHALAWDPDGQRTVMFGGLDKNGLVGTALWAWDGSLWTQPVTSGGPPPARAFHGMAYDGFQQVVVYGGLLGFTAPGDVWALRGTTWVALCTTPSCALEPRYGVTLAYDPHRKRVALHGGLTAGQAAVDGTWTWNGAASTWLKSAAAGSGPREHHTMVYDEAARRFVVYGGAAGVDLGDTWHGAWVGVPCTAATECGTRFCVDGVCCREACEGPCRRCDRANPITASGSRVRLVEGKLVFGPALHRAWLDGVCRTTGGSDPDKDCGGDGPCAGVCDLRGGCRYPGTEQLCGICTACDGRGGCSQLPATGQDERCPLLKCSWASPPCRTFVDARRCRSPGACATTWSECIRSDRPDGEACDIGNKIGTCLGGDCQTGP